MVAEVVRSCLEDQSLVSGLFEHILPVFEKRLARLRSQPGVYAILGNHDCADTVAAFEGFCQTKITRRENAPGKDAQAIMDDQPDDPSRSSGSGY